MNFVKRFWILLCLSAGVIFIMAACAGENINEGTLPSTSPESLLIAVGEVPSKATSTIEPEDGEESNSEQQQPTFTIIPTDTPTPEIQITQVITPTATVPSPVRLMELPPGTEVSVLLGTDYDSPNIGRTDTIILVFLNRQIGSASLLSIPRDLFVVIPGQEMGRINTVYALGGADLLFDTIEYNLGVRPQHWGLVHLDDFVRFVNDLGGIDVEVRRQLLNDCGGIPDGLVHMDGSTALCYVRERRTSSDFDRSRRQQDVLKEIFRKFMTLDNILRLPEWYKYYSATVQTDFGLLDLLGYIPFALRLYDGDNINRYQIDWDDVISVKLPESGAAVLLPNRYKIEPIIQQALNSIAKPVPTTSALETRAAELTETPIPSATFEE